MFKRIPTYLLVAALAVAACAIMFGPGAYMHAVTASASPVDMAANAMMASAALGVPMRAKFVIASVDRAVGHDGGVTAERVRFNAVCPPSFDKDGLSEDSTFARFSPQASCEIYINNPALHGKYAPGQKFYVDFTPAPAT